MRNAAPGAEETISYKIPAYKLQGRVLLYFAGWKEHYALYPADGRLVAAFGDELTPFLRSKGTLRFSFSEPVPVQLIGRIVRFRAQEITRRAKSKPRKRGTKPARSS